MDLNLIPIHTALFGMVERNEKNGDQTKNRLRVKNMKSILDKADPDTHEMSLTPHTSLRGCCRNKGREIRPCIQESFSGLSRHPLYHKGRVLAWQVLEN